MTLTITKFQNCLRLTQTKNKINYLEEKKVWRSVVKKIHEELLLEHKTMPKSQQRLKSDKHDSSTVKVNKIALSKGDGKKESKNLKE